MKQSPDPDLDANPDSAQDQWPRYIVVVVVAIWLAIWMLRISGINIL